MPVQLFVNASRRGLFAGPRRNETDEIDGARVPLIHIGLINNMPDSALEATERQFLNLLDSAAAGVLVHLSIYSLPDLPRNELGHRFINRRYSGIEDLWDAHLDGLIVTGTEPRASNLADEPYWRTLTKVFDWAESNTQSTILSCLAAHAAIQHIDGAVRRPLVEKRFGAFECVKASDHPLLGHVSLPAVVPHSRWNDVPERELVDGGYTVLTRSKDGSVDSFVKKRQSLFVFFQGHPEYERNTLLLEYRRDVGRYLRHERESYPAVPEGYFDKETRDLLSSLRSRYVSERKHELFDDFPTAQAEKGIANSWSQPATEIYRNWLFYLCAQKERKAKKKQPWKQLEHARSTDLAMSAALGKK